MKRILTSFLFLTTLTIFSVHSQNITNYNGEKKIDANGYTASMSRVEIFSKMTLVTIDLQATRNKSWLAYWSSPNTYILCATKKLPIVGFLSEINGRQMIDKAPFGHSAGWEHVKKGEIYKYTMVFRGRIPAGVETFSIVDEGDGDGSRGFGFANYRVYNPDPCTKTRYSEAAVRQAADMFPDKLIGVYEQITNEVLETKLDSELKETKLRFACIKNAGMYEIVYLSGFDAPWWETGDKMADVRTNGANNYILDYFNRDKSKESAKAIIGEGKVSVTISKDKVLYFRRVYPKGIF